MKPGSIAAAFAWATGAWASLGVVAVTSQSTTARVGLLPPVWVLAALVVGAAIVVAALRLSRDDTAPLWLALVVWLPWIPGPIPAALLLFDGPLAGVVVVLAAALVIGRALAHLAPTLRVGLRGHLAIAFGAAAVASGLTAWRLAPILPDGDEPHYLVITESLLFDGDLQIENNHRQGDYLVYADRDLKPDYLKRGRNGQIYSIHSPGLPALVLPSFAAGGYPGVVVFLVLLFGVASALTWRAAHQLTGDVTSAWVGWAGVVLSAPALFHSFTVYPDGPAALVVIGVMGLRGAERRRWQWLLAGAAIATLPWLHTRLALVAVVLAAVLALRIVAPGRSAVGRAFRPGTSAELKPRPTVPADESAGLRPRPAVRAATRELVALLAVPAISAVLWLTFFYVIYGTIDPRAPYGGRDGQFLAGDPERADGAASRSAVRPAPERADLRHRARRARDAVAHAQTSGDRARGDRDPLRPRRLGERDVVGRLQRAGAVPGAGAAADGAPAGRVVATARQPRPARVRARRARREPRDHAQRSRGRDAARCSTTAATASRSGSISSPRPSRSRARNRRSSAARSPPRGPRPRSGVPSRPRAGGRSAASTNALAGLTRLRQGYGGPPKHPKAEGPIDRVGRVDTSRQARRCRSRSWSPSSSRGRSAPDRRSRPARASFACWPRPASRTCRPRSPIERRIWSSPTRRGAHRRRSRALDRPQRRARALLADAERHQRVDWHADRRTRTS